MTQETNRERPPALAPATGSAAALKTRIARMRERRKSSSGHYSVKVDELMELLSILEAIIEPPNDQAEAIGG